MKNNTKNSNEPVDKQHYTASERFLYRNPPGTIKRKYLLRVVEHEEAEQEIRNAKRKRTTTERTEMSEVQRMDETPHYKQ